jgi:hypothetical protein
MHPPLNVAVKARSVVAEQLYKCANCGHVIARSAPKCPGCGTPGPMARHPNSWRTAEPAEAVAVMIAESGIESDANAGLKRQHDRLVLKLGIGGAVGTFALLVILLAIADGMGGVLGGVFIFLLGLLGAAGFVALMMPRYAGVFARRVPAPKDPLTGRPLRMLWWWRLFAGAITVLMFVALNDYMGRGSADTTARSIQPSESPSTEATPAEAGLETGEHQIVADNRFGCSDRDYFEKLISYIVAKDDQAFSQALQGGLLSGQCTNFKRGESVFLTDTAIFRGLVKIRRRGETQEYWTDTETIGK